MMIRCMYAPNLLDKLTPCLVKCTSNYDSITQKITCITIVYILFHLGANLENNGEYYWKSTSDPISLRYFHGHVKPATINYAGTKTIYYQSLRY